MNDTEKGIIEVMLLDQLKEERDKYTDSNKELMQELCDKLVRLGTYPATSAWGYTPLQMVEGYGVEWHIYKGHLECPHCKADLRDPKGPPGKREIGIYDRDRDSTTHFICPDCKGRIEWKT